MKEESVHVMVRVRPLNKKEIGENDKNCITVESDNAITLNDLANTSGTRSYTFDRVFTEGHAQKLIYDHSAFPIVEWLFEGFNCTIFAYGQTGCGKTHTMMGEADKKSLDDMIKEMCDKPQADKAESRNEKITGNRAELEYLTETGAWKVMDFEKVDGKWLLTFPKADKESMK